MEYHLEHHLFPMVPSYNLKKLRKEIDDQLPKPFNGLFEFYKHVLPSVIALATNPNDYYKVKLSSKFPFIIPDCRFSITGDVGCEIIISGSSLPQFVNAKVTIEKATKFKILKTDFFIFV